MISIFLICFREEENSNSAARSASHIVLHSGWLYILADIYYSREVINLLIKRLVTKSLSLNVYV